MSVEPFSESLNVPVKPIVRVRPEPFLHGSLHLFDRGLIFHGVLSRHDFSDYFPLRIRHYLLISIASVAMRRPRLNPKKDLATLLASKFGVILDLPLRANLGPDP